MEKRTTEDRLLLLLLPKCVLSPTWSGTIWKPSHCSTLHLGVGLGAAGVASKQGPLPGAAEALLGHRLSEPCSYPLNLGCYLHKME